MKAATRKGKQDRAGLGILLVLLAFLLFTGIDSSAKWLIQAGLAIPFVVFCRYLVHLVITVAVALAAGHSDFLRMRMPRLTLARGAMLGFGTSCNFIALAHLPLTVTVSIFFTVPLATTALAALVLGEQVGVRRWSAIAVGFGGVLIITQPWSASFHWAMLFSLGAVFATAVYALLTRRLAGEESPDTMQFWAAALPCLLLLPLAYAYFQLPTTPVDWFALVFMGVCGWAGHQVWGEAFRFAEASALAPFQYLQIVYMALASWLIFHQPPTTQTMAGAAVVVASGLYVWVRERVKAEAAPKSVAPRG